MGDYIKPNTEAIRLKAVDQLNQKLSVSGRVKSEADVLKLLLELEVHQIELQMQNEELWDAKIELEEVSNNYIELYDLAPSAYFSLSREGQIIRLNLSGAFLLGKERREIQNGYFDAFVSPGSKPGFHLFLEQVFKQQFKKTCNIQLSILGHSPIYVHLSGMVTGEGPCLLTVLDISESKKNEELLMASETRYRKIFESAREGILILDAETGMIVDVNLSLTEMLGYSKAYLVERAIWDQSSFKGIVNSRAQLCALGGQESLCLKDWVLETAEGDPIDVEILLLVYRVDQKKVIQINIKNITKAKLAEKQLKESEERFRITTENSSDAVFIANDQGHFLNVNAMAVQMLGFTRAEMLLFTIADISPPWRLEEYYHLMDQLIRQGSIFAVIELVRKGGLRVPVDLNAVFLPNGQIFASCRDITERTKINEALQESEFRFRRLYENAKIGLYRTTLQGDILLANKEMVRMLGYPTVEQLMERNLNNPGSEPSYDRQVFLDQIEKEGEVNDFESTWMRKDGDIFYVKESAQAIRNTEGVTLYYDGVVEDISERKRSEQELIEAKNKAEESDRLKSAFLANMSHEVRTPLNSIIGFSELMTDPDYSESDKQSFLGHIIANGNSLLTIISDILDISRMESGQFAIHPTRLNAREFVTNVRDRFSFQAEAKNLELKLTIHQGEEETCIFADTDRLNQVFNNLVGNALKFTARGSIEIGYQSRGLMVEFYVRDTGIGIPVAYHQKIFDRFRQVEDATTRTFGGNGLGLAITRNLVTLMGGTIWLDSEPGRGSVFYFTLKVGEKV